MAVSDAPNTPRLLLVEDDPSLTAVLRELFAGAVLEIALTADHALKAIRGRPFDAVVVDFDILGGVAVLYEALLTDLAAVLPRVVFLSLPTDERGWLFLRRTGRPALLKPFGVQDLMELVRQVGPDSPPPAGAD